MCQSVISMYEEYRKELRRQHKNIRGLAEWSGRTPDAVSKNFQGVNPIRLEDAYDALDYIGAPHSDMPKYFPKGGAKWESESA